MDTKVTSNIDNKNELHNNIDNEKEPMQYTKIDFQNINAKKHVKQLTDPKKLLQKLNIQKETITNLELCGNKEKAAGLKNKEIWKNALAKAQGEKIKDNPELLKKSIIKRKQQLRSSRNKWKTRVDNMTKTQESKQKKREENIQKRTKAKTLKKISHAVKRGKVIPGF